MNNLISFCSLKFLNFGISFRSLPCLMVYLLVNFHIFLHTKLHCGSYQIWILYPIFFIQIMYIGQATDDRPWHCSWGQRSPRPWRSSRWACPSPAVDWTVSEPSPSCACPLAAQPSSSSSPQSKNHNHSTELLISIKSVLMMGLGRYTICCIDTYHHI